MSISSARLPLSAVYLNLLQSRPVGPAAATVTPTTAPAPGKDGSAAEDQQQTPAANRAPGRGRLIDLLV
jgi:hypothetical protein